MPSQSKLLGDLISAAGTVTVNGSNLVANTVANSAFQTGSVENYFNAQGLPIGRNRIINGDMQVWQRGTSFTNIVNGTFSVDRFSTTTSGINLTITQDTLVPSATFKYSLKAVPASNATASECGIRQFIEQQNITDFAGRTVTGSAWVYSSKSTVKFRLGTQNATGGTDLAQSVSVTAATWTRITFSFLSYAAVTAWTSTPNASGGYLDISFVDNTALTTSDYLYITGVQLEVGSTATPFERRLYNQELANCQRYFQTVANGPTGSSNLTTSCIFGFQFPVVMRTAPSTAVTGAIRVSDISTSAFTQSSGTIANNLVTADGGSFILGNFTGMTINRPITLAQSSTGTIQLSAEL